jgi:uncharacterized protein (DUF1800 family)
MRPFRHVLRTALGATLATGVACSAAPGAGPGAPDGTPRPDGRALPLPDAAAIASREQTADQQVLHALNRLAFGPRPGDEARVRALGVDRWIALQLEPSRLPAPRGDSAVAAFPVLAMPMERLLAAYPPNAVLRRLAQRGMVRPGAGVPAPDSLRLTRADSVELFMLRRRTQTVGEQLVAGRVARAVASERQLEEVLTDFWLNHFSVFAGKNQGMRHLLVGYERDAIRPHVLGKFRTLLGAATRSPAMLVYLDNAQSVADSGRPRLVPPAVARRIEQRAVRRAMAERPALAQLSDSQRTMAVQQLRQRRRGLNENHARELLELHTLGVDGGYTQGDVTEAARVLTGWTVERPYESARFVFNPLVHDAGEKTVLGRRFPAGSGEAEGEALLDLLARHPATARHIATKLARRLVSDTPPAALVERATATFTRTDGDLREVVRTIVTSPEFFSRAAWRAKVKSPFEVVASALRALDARVDTTPRSAALVARLGQPIYGHQAPNGWPETGDAWVNTGAILGRINLGMALASGALPAARPRAWPAWDSLAALPRAAQVDGVVRALLGGDVSADMRTILESGDHPLMAQAASAGRDTSGTMGDALPGAMASAAPTPRMRRAEGGEAGTAIVRTPGARARGVGAQVGFAGAGAPAGLAQVLGLALGSPEFQRR